MERPRLLVCDENERLLRALQAALGERYQVMAAATRSEARQQVEAHGVDLALSEPGLADGPEAGLEILGWLRSRQPAATRILMTGEQDAGALVRPYNQGAMHRVLVKPWDEASLDALLTDCLAQPPREFLGRPGVAALDGRFLLLLNDEELVARLREQLSGHHEVHFAESLNSAFDQVSHHAPELVVLPVRFRGVHASEVMERLHKLEPELKGILLIEPGRRSESVARLINEGWPLRLLHTAAREGQTRMLLETALAAARSAQQPSSAQRSDRVPGAPRQRSLSRERLLKVRMIARKLKE